MKVSMKEQDCEQLTFLAEGSHASRSVLPGSDKAREMTVTSGLKCLESYGRSDPLGCLVRMCLASSIWHSTRCYLTWKTKATPHKRLLFQLAVSMPRTNENGYVFWPTPSTGAALCGGTGNFKTLVAMRDAGLITEQERKELSKGNGGRTNPGLLEWLMGYEQKFTELIPTPTATDYKGGVKSRWFGGGVYRGTLREFLECTPLGRIGPMNPEYLEWLMGYPIGWSGFKPLGNAVVPQQFYPFFEAMYKIETEGEQYD